jgi:hypothetical protein
MGKKRIPLFLVKFVRDLSPTFKLHTPPTSCPKVQVAALKGAAPRAVMPSRLNELRPRAMER